MQPSVIVFWLVHKQNTIAIRMVFVDFDTVSVFLVLWYNFHRIMKFIIIDIV